MSGTGESRPLDYIWNGQRITHYLNHGGTWQSAAATKANHHTLRPSVCGTERFAAGVHERCARPFHEHGACRFDPADIDSSTAVDS